MAKRMSKAAPQSDSQGSTHRRIRAKSEAAAEPATASQPGSETPPDNTPTTAATNEPGDNTNKHADHTKHPGDALVPGSAPEPVSVEELARRLCSRVGGRLMKEGRWWGEIEPVRNQMLREWKRLHPGGSKHEAQAWVYGELDRLYPPLDQPQPQPKPLEQEGKGSMSPHTPISGDSGQVRGLGDLPASWPALPANSSLANEIAWVQANRLLVVEEQANGSTRVHLARAAEPAPSRAALGWLETSCRSYAKFVDVASRALGNTESEQDAARRERMAIEEIRALLAEMIEAADDRTGN